MTLASAFAGACATGRDGVQAHQPAFISLGDRPDLPAQAGLMGVNAAVNSLGDREAVNSLLQGVERQLFRAALRRTRNTADAQEVCQESFLKAYAHLDQFLGAGDSPDAFRAWLYRIAENQSIDAIRRRHADKYLSLDAPTGNGEGSFAERVASNAASPEERYARREMRGFLAAAIEQLRPDLRSVCLLRDVLHYSTAETAERLRISATAVRLRLFRARRQLRERLRSNTRPPTRLANRERRASALAPAWTLAGWACGD